MEDIIRSKIQNLEEELADFKKESQKEVNRFMEETGLTAFINNMNIRVAEYQGKISALQELLKDDENIDDVDEG